MTRMSVWSWPKRFGFRILLLFLLFRYDLPSPLNRLPGWDMYFEVWKWLALALGRLLGLEVPVHEATGSGDSMLAWLTAAGALIAAVFCAGVWSLVQRKPVRHEKLADFLQLYCRIFLFTILISYGLVKLFAFQFPSPTEETLLSTYGESSPMGLMWTFMGASKPYQIFAGLLELAASALMLTRRTTTLGGLLVCGVMGNVLLLNLCYDVPVKLNSAELLLMGVVLVGLDAKRLISMLILNRPADAADQSFTWWATGRWRLARLGLCVLIFGFTTYENVTPFFLHSDEMGPPPADPLSAQGVYDVISSDAAERPTKLSLSPWGVKITLADGELVRLKNKEKTDEHRVMFSSIPGEAERTANLVVSSTGSEYTFTGTWNDAPVLIRTKKRSLGRPLLLTRGFHWVSEAPFNR